MAGIETLLFTHVVGPIVVNLVGRLLDAGKRHQFRRGKKTSGPTPDPGLRHQSAAPCCTVEETNHSLQQETEQRVIALRRQFAEQLAAAVKEADDKWACAVRDKAHITKPDTDIMRLRTDLQSTTPPDFCVFSIVGLKGCGKSSLVRDCLSFVGNTGQHCMQILSAGCSKTS
jgi:hypothetical protein